MLTESQDFVSSQSLTKTVQSRTPDVSVSFSVAVIKYPNKNNLGEKRFIWLIYLSYTESILTWKSKCQELEAASHIIFIAKSRERRVNVWSFFSSLISRILCPGNGAIHIG